VLYRPVDKKENYIKRCVAVAGDVIEIKDKKLYLDNELAHQPKFKQSNYTLDGELGFNSLEMLQQFNLREGIDYYQTGPSTYTIVLYQENYEKFKAIHGDKLKANPKQKGFYKEMLYQAYDKNSTHYYPVFPNDKQYDWTEDNFGPLQIPKRGDVVDLNHKTLPIYARIIHAYEKHDLEEKADGIYIDGKKVTTYTIEMNYYWLMGDNRNNSLDSRFWGFVPEDHVVGRAAFIWMSVNEKGYFGGVRWDRIFDKIK
jgi:signal peptidase I